MVKLVGGFVHLLAQLVEARENGAALLVGVDLDVVADGVARPEADNGFGGEAFFGDDSGEQCLRVGKEFLCFDAHDFIFEDLGETAVEFPGAKERAPVDERNDVRERNFGEDFRAEEFGAGNVDVSPIVRLFAGAGLREGEERALVAASGEFFALAFLLGGVFSDERRLLLRRE